MYAVIKQRQQSSALSDSRTRAQIQVLQESLRDDRQFELDSFMCAATGSATHTTASAINIDSCDGNEDAVASSNSPNEKVDVPPDSQAQSVLHNLLLNILQLLKVHCDVVELRQTEQQIFVAHNVRKKSSLETDCASAELHRGFAVHVETLNLTVGSTILDDTNVQTQTLLSSPGADIFIAQELKKLVVRVYGQVRLSYTEKMRDEFWNSSLQLSDNNSEDCDDDHEDDNTDATNSRDSGANNNWLHVLFDQDIELTAMEPVERADRCTASVLRLSKCSYTTAMQWCVKKLSLQHGKVVVTARNVRTRTIQSVQIHLNDRHVGTVRNLSFSYNRFGHVEIDANRETFKCATTSQQLLSLVQTLESFGLHLQAMFPTQPLTGVICSDRETRATPENSSVSETETKRSQGAQKQNESKPLRKQFVVNGRAMLFDNYLPNEKKKKNTKQPEFRQCCENHFKTVCILPPASVCPFSIKINNVCLFWSISDTDTSGDGDNNNNNNNDNSNYDDSYKQQNRSSLRLCALVLSATFRQLSYPSKEVDFCEYKAQSAFRVVLKEWEIRDHVSHSHWRRLVSCSGTLKYPATQVCVIQKLRYLPFPTRNSYAITMNVMPIHVALHEATFVFLQRFFETLRGRSSVRENAENDNWSDCDSADDKESTVTDDVLSSSPYALCSVYATDNQIVDSMCLTTIEQLNVNDICVSIDYKPQATNSLQEMMRNAEFVYLLRSIPIENAKVHLQPLSVRNVRLDHVIDTVMATYMPNWHKLAKAYVRGIQPLHVVLRLGSSALNIIKIPLAEFNDPNGDVLVAMGDSLRTMTVELLRLGTRASTLSYKVLRNVDTFLSDDAMTQEKSSAKKKVGKEIDIDNETRVRAKTRSESIYSNQPASMSEGFKDSWRHVRRGIRGGTRALAHEPYRSFQESGTTGFLSATARALPCAVLRPAIGFTGAVARMTQALQNTVDPTLKLQADEKWKSFRN